MRLAGRNGGILLLVVISILLITGLLLVRFFQMSQEARFATFKLEQRASIRLIAESALDEAFQCFVLRTADPASEEAKWLREDRHGMRSIPVPMSSGIELSQGRCQVTVSASVRNFFDRDKKGNPYSTAGEGRGVLVLSAAVCLQDHAGRPAMSGELRRHHFFLLSALVAPISSVPQRTSQAFPLGYVLLVRNGGREFSESGGESINPHGGQGFTIRQPSAGPFGKIWIADNQPDDPPFLNVRPDQSWLLTGLLPPSGNGVIRRLDESDCRKILDSIPEGSNVTGEFVASVASSVAPPALSPSSLEGSTRKIGLAVIENQQGLRSSESNVAPGVDLLGDDPAFAMQHVQEIVQGKLFRRFFHFVLFRLATPGNAGARVSEFPCIGGFSTWPPLLRSLFDQQSGTAGEASSEDFLRGLESYENQHPSSPPLTSKFVRNLAYGSTSSDYSVREDDFFPRPPDLWDRKGNAVPIDSLKAMPFNQYGMYFRTVPNQSKLEDLGILETTGSEQILHLRGIVSVCGNDNHLRLGAGGRPVRVRGQGVLIADEITIEDGITCDPGSVCVLWAINRSITVKTGKRIEAYLMALRDQYADRLDGTLKVVGGPLNLMGGLAVDRLDLHHWSAGAHVLTYDPKFSHQTSPQFVLNLSRTVTFSRWSEIDPDDGERGMTDAADPSRPSTGTGPGESR